jgi:hypothetical protein
MVIGVQARQALQVSIDSMVCFRASFRQGRRGRKSATRHGQR